MKTILIAICLLVGCTNEADIGTDHASCAFSACGGDIGGSWTLVDACLQDSSVPTCPQAAYAADVTAASGTWTFAQDMTFSVDYATTTDLAYTLPASCSQTHMTCAEYQSETSAAVTCTGTPATGCSCQGTDQESNMTAGTWSVSGNQLTATTVINGVTAPPAIMDYCVQGDSLQIKAVYQTSTVIWILHR